MTIWTKDRQARLITLIEEDGVSLAEASRVLSREAGRRISRSAINGKVHRLRQTGQIRASVIVRPDDADRRRRKPSSLAPIGSADPIGALDRPLDTLPGPSTPDCPASAAPSPDGVTLLELEDGQCRWPIGERSGETLFCGQPTVRPSSGAVARVRYTGLERTHCQAHLRASVHPAVFDKIKNPDRLSPERRRRLGLDPHSAPPASSLSSEIQP